MSALITTLPPSFADMSTTAPSVGDDLFNGGFSFHDLISIVNPLQHFPIVSTIYRAVTGDTIKPLERIAGDTLYGGVWGLVSSVANVAFQEITGKDFGDTALALLEGDDGDQTTNVAANATAPSVTAIAAPTSNATLDTTIAPIAAASIAPNLIATAPPAVLQPKFSNAAAVRSTQSANAMALMAAMSQNADTNLSQRANAAYRQSLALPTNLSVDSIPMY